MNTDLIKGVSLAIAQATGTAFEAKSARGVAGGCINQGYVVSEGSHQFFVKTNRADMHAMFLAEADGLDEIIASKSIRAPKPIADGCAAGHAFLVLEYLALNEGRVDDNALAQQLANMHRKHATTFGWHRDNTIGSTPQFNQQSNDWCHFWREQRLGYQLSLAAENGYTGRIQERGARLMDELATLLNGHTPPAALVHGDLWSGNYGALANGSPVIFDPAAYYGDRETDLAMTELFGGFSPRFYDAYRDAYPLDPGYTTRKIIYNLYHVLNHLNLFGGGYQSQAQHMIDTLLSETGK